jgi:hypothetical protein
MTLKNLDGSSCARALLDNANVPMGKVNLRQVRTWDLLANTAKVS